ncbi:MAG: ABC transporter ATP-binding protein [Rubrivivax sp.]|nr:ABC transporter ATP-binding protein [Rubrivivax sp.]
MKMTGERNPAAAVDEAARRDAPVLELQGLTIALPAGGGRPAAVRDLSLAIAPGEVACLLGAAGAGKSTVADAVLGLLAPALHLDRGRILFAGEDVTRAAPARLRALRGAGVSLLRPEPAAALDPLLTCGQQLELLLRQRTRLARAARRERALTLLAEMRLPGPERIAARHPHQLGRDERLRVLTALALALDPALLVADDPMRGLDVPAQAAFVALVRELQRRRGMALLWLGDDFAVAAALAQRVCVLHRGEAIEAGAPRALLEHAQHEHTRALVAALPRLQARARPANPQAPVVLRVSELAMTYRHGRLPGRRREVQALEGVSFEVHRGRTLGLVGVAGSGKSTIARCVARRLQPSAGTIRLGRDDITQFRGAEARPLLRRVQMLLPDHGRLLDPQRTVREALIEGPLNFGMPRDLAEDRARDLLELVQLPADAFERPAQRLGAVERQCVVIARALMLEPELLVADEVCSTLDLPAQARLRALFELINRRLPVALLFLTHDLRIASQVCDEIAVLCAGEIVEQGPVDRVCSDPQHECTRALLAAARAPGLALDVREPVKI